MPRYVIEREMPGAGSLSDAELQGASGKSCSVIRDLGPGISWVQSYVTDDKIYCVYDAASEVEIQKHAEQAGFPANTVNQVRRVIDPTWEK